jgi:MoaA/NifB/PqqE/SkfB family radical SAM enzyme
MRIPPWIAYQTWEIGSEALTLIENIRDNRIITFENESSLLWASISNNVGAARLSEIASELMVEDELDDFLEELLHLGLLTKSDDERELNTFKIPPPVEGEGETFPEDKAIELKVKQWCEARGFLFTGHWEVTYRCNEKCVHCYNPGAAHFPSEKPARKRDELTTDEVKSMLFELREAGAFRLILSGGEVTLRKDFWEIIKYARSLGFSVSIYTNGLLVDEEFSKRLAKFWPSEVSISLYSHDPQLHDAITKTRGSHEKSIKALKYLNNSGIKTSVKTPLINTTSETISETQVLAQRLGARHEVDPLISPGADGGMQPTQLNITDELSLILLATDPNSSFFCGEGPSFGEFRRPKNQHLCSAGHTSIGISPEGVISPCNSMPFPVATFRENGLLPVWKEATRPSSVDVKTQKNDKNSILGLWRGKVLSDYVECGTHRRCGWCSSKCSGLAMLEHGDPLGVSTINCRHASARMIAADLLKKGYNHSDVNEILSEISSKLEKDEEDFRENKQYLRNQNLVNSVAIESVANNVKPTIKDYTSFIADDGRRILVSGPQEAAKTLRRFENISKTLGLAGDN